MAAAAVNTRYTQGEDKGEIVDAAVRVVLKEREFLLSSFQHLIRGAHEAQVPEHSRSIMLAAVDKLTVIKKTDLAQHLLQQFNQVEKLIQDLRDNSSAKSQELRKYTFFTQQIFDFVLQKLEIEREQLAFALFLVVFHREISMDILTDIIKILQSLHPQDNVMNYLFAAVICKFSSPNYFASLTNLAQSSIQAFDTVLSAEWEVKTLKSAIKFTWNLFLKQKYESGVVQSDQKYADAIQEAVQANALAFFFNHILLPKFQYDELLLDLVQECLSGIYQDDLSKATLKKVSTTTRSLDSIFKAYLSRIQETVFESYIKTMFKYIKQMKNIDEDSDQTSRNAMVIDRSAASQRHFETLLAIIALLYGADSDAGLLYWHDQELVKFVKMSCETRSPRLFRVFLIAFSSLSNGPRCSQQAHEFLSVENMSISYLKIIQVIKNVTSNLHSHQDQILNIDEELLLRCYLLVFRTIITSDMAIRDILFEHQSIRAVQTLFNLLVCRVPLKMKAAIFMTLAAFCDPSHGRYPVDSLITLWSLLENSKLLLPEGAIALPKTANGTNSVLAFDLTDLEATQQQYFETISFLTFFRNLVSLKSYSPELENFINRLGAPNRRPGLAPYLEFVVKYVLLPLNSRGYLKTEDKWKMTRLSCETLLKCISSFEKTVTLFEAEAQRSLVDATASASSKVDHESFVVLGQLFEGSSLTELIFSLLRIDFNTLNSTNCEDLTQTVLACLNILKECLIQQDLFTKEMSKITAKASNYVKFDQVLAFHQDIVVQLALLINCEVSDDICLLSSEIMNILRERPIFKATYQNQVLGGVTTKLVSILQGSSESERIIAGYAYQLLNDRLYVVSGTQGQKIGKAFQIILGLILDESNGEPRISDFGIYLMGFDTNKPLAYANFDFLDRPVSSCLKVFLDMLENSTTESLSMYLHSMKVIYGLCMHQQLSDNMLRYLRVSTSFFNKELRASLDRFDESDSNASIWLEIRSYFCKILTREIESASSSGHSSYVKNLVSFLLNSPSSMEPSSNKIADHNIPAILEILRQQEIQSLDLQTPLDPNVLSVLSYVQCPYSTAGTNDFKVSLFNIENALYRLQWIVSSVKPPGATSFSITPDEAREIIQILLEFNQKERIRYVRYMYLSAWSALIEAVVQEFSGFDSGEKESLVVILSLILDKLQRASNSSIAFDVISKSVCLITNRLADSSKDISEFHKANSLKDILGLILVIIASPECGYVARNHLVLSISDLLDMLRECSQEIDVQALMTEYSPRLFEVVGRHYSAADDTGKIASLYCLTKAFQLSSESTHPVLIDYLQKRDVLNQIIHSFSTLNAELSEAFVLGTSEHFNAAYTFEANCGLLCCAISTEGGCKKVLDLGVFDQFRKFDVLDRVSSIAKQEGSIFVYS